MQNLLVGKEISIRVESNEILENASFSISSESRAALVGPNGAGKSTILKVLGNIDLPFEGEVVRRRGLLVEYVPQFIPPEILRLTPVQALEKRIAEVNPNVEDWRLYETLSLLNLPDHCLEIPLGALSGGEANKVLLGRALVVNPDIVLLDEPTNHMDSEAILEFEKFLTNDVHVPFLLVSHDRQLLDNVTNETILLRDKRLYYFGMPYSEAMDELARQDAKALARYENEGREIARLESSARKLQQWAKLNSDFSTRYKGIVTRIDRMKEDRTFVGRDKAMTLELGDPDVNVQSLLRVKEFDVVTPDDRKLFSVRNLALKPGDRAVVLGRNGVGKSTFIRGVVDSFGQEDKQIVFNPQARLGYYDQELRRIDLNSTPLEFLRETSRQTVETLHSALAKAGFPYARHHDRLEKFSGGEKARLLFLALRLTKPNFLILDEPTNHIDVGGIEDLENSLRDSSLTALFVSHDRRFVENVANRFFLIKNGSFYEVGSMDEYYTMLGEPLTQAGKDLTRLSGQQILDRIDLLEKRPATNPSPEYSSIEEELNQLYQLLEGKTK